MKFVRAGHGVCAWCGGRYLDLALAEQEVALICLACWMAAKVPKCDGHSDGPVMGETFFCNGTCKA